MAYEHEPNNRQSLFALHEVIGATRALAAALQEAAAVLQEQTGLSVPERALLLELRKGGPLTVPDLARRRGVTRQSVQTTINALLAAGAVESVPNPAHRRSRLMALTESGTERIRGVMRLEGELMQGLAANLAGPELREAAAVLTGVQSLLTERVPLARRD